MADAKCIEEHHRFTDPPPVYQEQVGSSPNPQYPPAPTNTVYVTSPAQVTYVHGHSPVFGNAPVRCSCPNCRANVVTQLKYKSGVAAWLISGGLCLLGLGCGCCLIPFCFDGCKDVEHYCPNCRAFVGRYRRV